MHKVNKKGFTLLEMMVAIAIFTIIILAVVGIFKNSMEGQRSAVAAQNTQESMHYVFEVISKEIRLAKESNTECDSIITSLGFPVTTANTKLYHSANGGKIFYFKNKDNECVAYYIENDTNGVPRFKVFRDDISDGFNNTSFYITPDEINVNRFDFSINDNAIGVSKSQQPRITINMQVEMNTSQNIHKQTLNIQTTLSSRYYE